MKVEQRLSRDVVTFGSLLCGDLFSFPSDNKRIYMKVTGLHIVCLQDGFCASLDDPERIVAYYPGATIVIEQNR